ncbi:hypothetical protein BAE30_15925 [Acidithiobacillus caldus]|uniref:Uncharacterized protein n=1 Tax=Acidithiobacillus caldus TaxID=33059 RepID=A0A1E7YRP9_9PROT|nr:hypothetical protein BAE30_15925 [Acidithiobacillus caldus]
MANRPFSLLREGIYAAKAMAEHPERHTQTELAGMEDDLRILASCLWDYVGVFGKIMLYTKEDKNAWDEDHLFNFGESLAMLSDLAQGIEDIRFALRNPETVKAEREEKAHA